MRATFILDSERERGFALAAVMKARRGMQVRISKPNRNDGQNARLHALLTDIADQQPWPKDSDEFHDGTWWKRRTTLGWLLEEKANQRAEVITSLHGDEFGLLIPHTSDLNVEQCAALCEWATMFGATNGVVFKEPKRGPEPPPREDDR